MTQLDRAIVGTKNLSDQVSEGAKYVVIMAGGQSSYLYLDNYTLDGKGNLTGYMGGEIVLALPKSQSWAILGLSVVNIDTYETLYRRTLSDSQTLADMTKGLGLAVPDEGESLDLDHEKMIRRAYL